MAVLLFQGFTRKAGTRPPEEVWTSPPGIYPGFQSKRPQPWRAFDPPVPAGCSGRQGAMPWMPNDFGFASCLPPILKKGRQSSHRGICLPVWVKTPCGELINYTGLDATCTEKHQLPRRPMAERLHWAGFSASKWKPLKYRIAETDFALALGNPRPRENRPHRFFAC